MPRSSTLQTGLSRLSSALRGTSTRLGHGGSRINSKMGGSRLFRSDTKTAFDDNFSQLLKDIEDPEARGILLELKSEMFETTKKMLEKQ